eukprot:scaffold12941_cov120-Isochrysis_galbana.AAC.5
MRFLEDRRRVGEHAGVDEAQCCGKGLQADARCAEVVALAAGGAEEAIQQREKEVRVCRKRQLDVSKVAGTHGVVEPASDTGLVMISRPHPRVVQPAGERPIHDITLP